MAAGVVAVAVAVAAAVAATADVAADSQHQRRRTMSWAMSLHGGTQYDSNSAVLQLERPYDPGVLVSVLGFF